MDVVIPAAGAGMRFLPVSHVVPKELLPLGTRPLIHHALDEAERAGFDRAIVVLSRAKTAIRAYFEPASALETSLRDGGHAAAVRLVQEARAIARRLSVTFLEQPGQLGLGDAVLRCRPIAGDRFAVLLPDDVITTTAHWTDLLDAHAETGAACFSVRPVPADQVQRFGIAVCEPAARGLRVLAVHEKPRAGEVPSTLAVLGRYVVTGPVLDALAGAERHAGEELQLTAGLDAALGRPPGVLAAVFAGEHYDSGTPEDYASSAARFVSRHHVPAGGPASAGREAACARATPT